MSEQQILQNLVQQNAGTHTQGQAAVPSAANTGNPNTVWNHTTYAVSPGQPTQFNLTSTPVTPSNPGYTPPFTADPYLAKAMSSIPQASGNEHVDRILNSLFSGGGQGGPTGGGGSGWGGGGGGGTGGGGAGGGGTGGGSWQRGGGEGISVGPISGPTWGAGATNWESNYANAMPNTNLSQSGLGRTEALDWLNSLNGLSNTQGGSGELSQIGSYLGDKLKAIGLDLGQSWNTFVSNITGQNGGAAVLGEILTILGVPGANQLVGQFFGPEVKDKAALESIMKQQLDSALTNMSTEAKQQAAQMVDSYIRETGTNAAMNVLQQYTGGNQEMTAADWDRWYKSQPEYTNAEWKDKQESMAWNNFWYGSGSRTRNPVTGTMSDSNVGDFLNSLAAEALAMEKKMRNMYTKMR